jgi:hypothetical protein
MATSFLNSNEKNWFADAADTWFETFKRSIIIHKEPIKNIVQNTTSQMVGYDESSNIVDYSYTPRNQTFDAVIKYKSDDGLILDEETKLKFLDQSVLIYVGEEAKDYINEDKTEKISFDGKDFNINSSSIVRNYFTKNYYIYFLKETS